MFVSESMNSKFSICLLVQVRNVQLLKKKKKKKQPEKYIADTLI